MNDMNNFTYYCECCQGDHDRGYVCPQESERASGRVAASCSPAAGDEPSRLVERRHSPVGDVLDELEERITRQRDLAKRMSRPRREGDPEWEWMDGAREGLTHALDFLEAAIAKHGPSERSERRANAKEHLPR